MIRVIRGEDKQFAIILRKDNGDPYDLASVTAIEVCLPGETVVQNITLAASEITITNSTLGKIVCNISDTKSALLRVGDNQTFECKIDEGTKRTKVKFTEQLSVQSSIC